jgi:Ni,Fe-hydrogenase I cytochrome b subunit
MVAGQTSKGKIEFQPSLITLKNVHLQGSISADISHYHKALEWVLLAFVVALPVILWLR